MFWAWRDSEAAVTMSYDQWEGHLQDIYNTLDKAGTCGTSSAKGERVGCH